LGYPFVDFSDSRKSVYGVTTTSAATAAVQREYAANIFSQCGYGGDGSKSSGRCPANEDSALVYGGQTLHGFNRGANVSRGGFSCAFEIVAVRVIARNSLAIWPSG
jgi:hypothetical protein